jgi:hypothetical protein
MSRIRRHRSLPLADRVQGALASVRSALARAWLVLHRRPATPIEVLVVDRTRRRGLERQLGVGLRRLERLLPPPTPGRLAVVVQQSIAGDPAPTGCVQVAELPDGTRRTVLRVALVVDGRRLTPDELLAALCDQWLAHACGDGDRAAARSDHLDARPVGPTPLAVLRPDPLLPRPATRPADPADDAGAADRGWTTP